MSITLGFQFKLISSKLVISIKGTEFTNQVRRMWYHHDILSSVGFKFKSISSSLKRLVVHKGFWIHKLVLSLTSLTLGIFNSSLTKDPGGWFNTSKIYAFKTFLRKNKNECHQFQKYMHSKLFFRSYAFKTVVIIAVSF
jgi:hypothetical protein